MPLGAQLPVRLDSQVEVSLEAIAERIGTTKSSIIRLLTKTFVDSVAEAGGSVQLPPKWGQWFDRLPPSDRRSVAGRLRRGQGSARREKEGKPGRAAARVAKRPQGGNRARVSK